MAAEKCATCSSGRTCINGRFCLKMKKYVEYTDKPVCNNE
nr:MAG TPA_asm: hypothetical protein [Caudoviricetes sp.]